MTATCFLACKIVSFKDKFCEIHNYEQVKVNKAQLRPARKKWLHIAVLISHSICF